MKYLKISEEAEIIASLVTDVNHIQWYTETRGLKLLGTAADLPTALRDAGVQRMRFTKADEKLQGEFVRGEIYYDGFDKLHYLIFQKALIVLACPKATDAARRAELQYFGIEEQDFLNRTLPCLEFLGYVPDAENVTLAAAGFDKSLKALHGKPEFVRFYRLGNNFVRVAQFEKSRFILFSSELQRKEIYSDLAIVFNRDRLERRVRELLGLENGVLRFVLMNHVEVDLPVNQHAPEWSGILFMKCEHMGGGILSISK